MSSIPPAFYPVALVQDRYGGGYSGGAWLAVANADELADPANTSRIAWAMGDDGPAGCDIVAQEFWCCPPPWISSGSSPDEAIARLLAQDAG